MSREKGIRGEHATLVAMSNDTVGMRVSHHVKRYTSAKVWERVQTWRRHKELIKEMATLPEDKEPTAEMLRLPEQAADMAVEIVEGSFHEPRVSYSLEPRNDDDVAHMRYITSFYVLKYSTEHEAFVPIKSSKHKKYGYLSYWRETQLERLDMDRVARNDPRILDLLIEIQAANRVAATFRSAHGADQQHLSLGTELYRTNKDSVLKPEPVLQAVSLHYNGDLIGVEDPRVRAYIDEYLVKKPVPKAWLSGNHGEELASFHVDTDKLPVVVLPGTLKQKLELRRLPEPMMSIDSGLNTPNVW